MAFTGPGGTLLEIQRRDGLWALLVGGAVVHQSSPQGDAGGGAALQWDFALPTGHHRVELTDAGGHGQRVLMDGVALAAPPGTLTFTGPGGALLELRGTG